MRLPYFWMHTEARNDAKLRMLTAEQHRVWFRLLCYAAEQDRRGTVPVASWSLVAVEVSDGDEALLAETCQRLESLRIIGPEWRAEEGAREIGFLNFDRRNERKPSDRPEAAADRKRKERERAKARKDEEASETPEDGSCHAMSRDVTPCHADVTPPSRPCHAVSRDVTDREEKRREENTTTPKPPSGIEGGSGGGGDPAPPIRVHQPQAEAEDSEPFVPPPAEAPPPPPPLPAHVEAACRSANALFPDQGFDQLVASVAPPEDDMPHMLAAMTQAKAKGKPSWAYIMGTYRRLLIEKPKAAGAPKRTEAEDYVQLHPLNPKAIERARRLANAAG